MGQKDPILVSSNAYLNYSGVADVQAVLLSILELMNTEIW